MKNAWMQTTVEIETVDSKGNPITLDNIPANKQEGTDKLLVDPFDVARAEIEYYAEEKGLIGRDVPLLLLLYARPGVFKEGEIHFKYHLNKMLFYFWKNLEKEYLGEVLPHDDFKPEKRGPVPEHIDEDLQRLKDAGLISLTYHQWGQSKKQSSLKTELTDKGLKTIKQLRSAIDDIFILEAAHTKEQIFPLSPLTVKNKVHKEFPEYEKTYTEEDID